MHCVGHQKGAERERGVRAPAPKSSHITGALAYVFQPDSYQHGLSSPWPCRAVLEQVGRVLSYCSLGTTLVSLVKAGFLKKSLELHHRVRNTAIDHICMFNPFLTKEVFSSFKHSIYTHVQFLSATYFPAFCLKWLRNSSQSKLFPFGEPEKQGWGSHRQREEKLKYSNMPRVFSSS